MMHGEYSKDISRGHRVAIGVAHAVMGVAFMLGLALVLGYIVMLLWNAILPELLGTRQVSYWQAVGLLILARLLVGGFHHRPHGRFGRRRRGFRGFGHWRESKLDEFVERGSSAGERQWPPNFSKPSE